MLVQLYAVDRRTHERHRLVRTHRRPRADMRRNDHIAIKAIIFACHETQFECARDGDECTVAVGDEADPCRSCADSAEAPDDAQRWSDATASLATRSGNQRANRISRSAFASQRADGDIRDPRVAHGTLDAHTIRMGAIEEVERIEDLPPEHRLRVYPTAAVPPTRSSIGT